ncbi:Ig-like domain-containing protein [Nocardioides marmorisolisilvae]|uniref:Tandem-95 repeat protein n=1 Tax=Nocardioides marmorisolisilvae TaxID=1542737 RepID=A0A3N0DZR2_9ACTN|nr:Ig-like domain-containing protein [Nocardioides marmorisolisilvae]RNL81098.1 hypothetical protein EFL95_01590 [Nocardioides marmorisolisilvae]
MARHRTSRTRRLITVAQVAALVLGLAIVLVPAEAGAAGTPYTFMEEKFDGATFPPTDWELTSGDWTRSCSPVPPGGGCAAVATVTSPDFATTEMRFNPSTQIPANLENATLTFTSNFDPGATSSGDFVNVYQPLVGSDLGDRRLLFDFTNSGDAPGQSVTHTIPLDHFNLPLDFRWSSAGDTGASPSKTWAISDVKISGTLPATAYTLTADPIPNTTYPHVVAGTPVTITLSGSSDPVGDTLNFAITEQPHIGTLGAITPVDATHAKVTYTTGATDCPDPDGVAGFLCIDTFKYKATDAAGNESTPVSATLDVHPGGAGGQQVSISAPTSTSYVTIGQGGQPTQAGDLTGQVSLVPAGFPDAVEIHLHVDTGTIDLLNADASGVTYMNGTGNNSADVQFKGSIAKVNTALAMFLYHPPAGTTPTATIDLYAADLGPTGQSGFIVQDHKTITVNGVVNVPRPVLTMPTGPLSIASNAGPLAFPAGAATGISFVDGGATSSTNDTVSLSVTGGKLSLPDSDTTGPTPLVTVLSNPSGIQITGKVDDLNTALTHLTFDPTNVVSSPVTLSGFVSDPDTGLVSQSANASITVVQAPWLYGTTSTGTLQNVPTTIFLCGRGPSGAQLSYTITGGPSHGTFVADPSASAATSGCSINPDTLISGYTYTPTTGYIGADRVDYQITDASTGLSTTASVDITVRAHTKPTAYAVSASTRQDDPVDVTLCGTNPDPSPVLSFEIVSSPGSGTLMPKGTPALNTCSNGDTAYTYTYFPNAGAFTSDGTDAFSYRVSNGAVSDPVNATITVATRTPQIAVVPLTVNENSSIGFMICATQPNGPLTFDTVGPSHGTLDSQAAATSAPSCPSGYNSAKYQRYVPTQYYSGSDLIGITATDGSYTSHQALYPITVNFVEIPPTADPKTLTVLAGQSSSVILTGSSVHSLPLTFRVVSGPTHGTLTGTLPNLTYTPSIANGTDSFTYVANDGTADGAPATVQITVTSPSLSTAVCLPGTTEIGPDQYPCVSDLQQVPDGSGGTTGLAHTSGARGARQYVQYKVTNNSALADTVTLTAPAGSNGWTTNYAIAGADRTADITGGGVAVPLAAGASAYVRVTVFAPQSFPAPPSFPITVHAVSGNAALVTSDQRFLVMDGTSSPSPSLTQGDGTGRVTWPAFFTVAPAMVAGGPDGRAVLEPGITGTGDNTFTIKADVQSKPSDLGFKVILGSANDVTSQVLAGTLTLQCYADIGCPPLKVVLTPGSTGGPVSVLFTQTSTIDGQQSYALLGATVAGSVGPDFYTTPPRLGMSVFEPTPSTQVISAPVQENHSATQRVFLRTVGDVTDTFTVNAAVTGSGAVTIKATAPALFGQEGNPVDVTTAIRNGTFKPTLANGQEVVLFVTTAAGATAGTDAADVVLTATSQLAPTKVDSFAVQFPTYSYRPDEMLTTSDGTVVGANVYETGTGSGQSAFFTTTLSPRDIKVTFADRGAGPQPSADSVVVKAPGSTADFDLSYRLVSGSSSTDVTDKVTGGGLTVSLRPGTPTLVMSAASSQTSRTGRPGYFTISATSVASGLADAVQVQLLTTGASQLRFGGLPQAEPDDITQMVAADGFSDRTAPIKPAGYAPGVLYGAYPDPSGQKFVYDSAYDDFDVQIASQYLTKVRHRLVVSAPSLTQRTTPAWQRDVFSSTYRNSGDIQRPANPLADDGVHPRFTVNGVDVTKAVLAGTWTTDPMLSGDTVNLHVSFSPAAGDSRRYAPLAITLLNDDTGDVEDVLSFGLSSIVTCDDDSFGQKRIKVGTKHLNFRSYDRTNGGAECLQHLTHSWITKLPMVFSSDEASPDDAPKGLWLLPQAGSMIRVDTDTLDVTSPLAKGYVDTALLGEDGLPDPTTYRVYNYLGTYTGLTWHTADGKNGLEVGDSTILAPSPFPLIKPAQSGWPGNTMDAKRYFQVQTTTGTPVMVGTMRVNQPWFHGDVNLVMPVDNDTGLVLDYAAPPDLTATLPGDDSTESYGMFWTVRKDGVVTQGGCLGLPPAFFNLLGLDKSKCIISVTTVFRPIPSDPSVEAKIAQITFALKVVKFEVGTPTFNLKDLSGEIDLDPTSGDVTKVVANANFGVGPVTPCYAAQKARPAGTVVSYTQKAQDQLCPKNYFGFSTEITFQQGGFTSANSTTGYGIKFVGTLTFLNLVQLASVEADISTSPFNFHFANSPIDLSVDAGIPIKANITLEGDVGELGFDIGMKGSISVMDQEIASASGIVSTKGIGICGGLAGVSVGFGQPWDSDPTFYPSGCTTDQFKVTS